MVEVLLMRQKSKKLINTYARLHGSVNCYTAEKSFAM